MIKDKKLIHTKKNVKWKEKKRKEKYIKIYVKKRLPPSSKFWGKLALNHSKLLYLIIMRLINDSYLLMERPSKIICFRN